MEEARQEIDRSLYLSRFCMGNIGLSFEKPPNASAYFRQKIMFVLSVGTIFYHVFSEIAYICLTFSNSPRVEEVVPLFHTFGYGFLSIAKLIALWYKKQVFGQLISELYGIWPVLPMGDEAKSMKEKSLAALSIAHRWYFFVNVSGVWFYNVTPFIDFFYRKLWLVCVNVLWQRTEAQIGYVWVSWYPFDKHQPIAHVAVYIFEMFAGQTSVWIMIGTDLLFTGLASHICLLLKLLQKRLEALASTPATDEEYYQEILENIKLHQRLIRYCNDIEGAFSLTNLVNIIMSSVNICCVVFVIVLLEPLLTISSKLFLVSALIQIGVLCWYGDYILHANGDIAQSAYNSKWYLTNPKCRRALLFLIIRAQKPIAFTAWKITNMSLVTYSSIMTRSYSYFALLYTMFNEN